MQPLVAALNGLFARIAQLLEAERRFTADAAHELRTPIAAIRAQAQVALAAASDEGERRHALEATLIGCDRAAHLVDQLLTLSRLEYAAPAPATALDVSALARRVVADLAPLALAKQQSIELDAAQPCSARGDEALLGALLRNLVDNAIRYSPPSARVRVAVAPGAAEARKVELTVEDSGPGMTDEHRAHLGERFFRVLGNEQPGSGLGWSIVRRIAAAHGATIDVGRSAALGGLRVRVVLG
jgi:two-component system sensor histidine kinase QseC